MAARKKKTRHGATQPESERKAKAVLLRLLPATTRRLDMLAKRKGCSRSELVAQAVAGMGSGDASWREAQDLAEALNVPAGTELQPLVDLIERAAGDRSVER